VLLYAGRLVGLKGVEYLLEAVASLQREGRHCSTVLVGDGPDREHLVKRVEELQLQNVHFAGPKMPDRMAAYYRSADCLIFPTLDDVWGLVVNEAIWSGLPVLASKYAGCASELLAPENIFDPLDVTQFTTVLRRALSGEVQRTDNRVLWKTAAVVEAIEREVKRVVAPPPRVALLVNFISPYRAPVYRCLADAFTLTVFHGKEMTRALRPEWKYFRAELGPARIKESWGIVFRRRWLHEQTGALYEERPFHMTFGYLWDLIRYRPAAVISNEMGVRTLIALFYSTLWRKPLWVWWGGTRHTEAAVGGFKRIVRRFLAGWVKHWISYGASSTEYLRSIGVAADHILEIQNCVDEDLFRQQVPPSLAISPRPVLLHVGRLVGLKGIDRLLCAAAQLQREGEKFSLALVGSGPETQHLETLAAQLELRHTQFLPPQPPSAMPGVYRSADCLVFPTLQDVWGLVVNEAMWCGLPVVASVHAGCASELLPAEAIFDPDDREAFVAVLRRAIRGQIPAPDLSRLKTKQQVASLIIADIQRVLENRQ
jgi:glycosyltransferase involved in cell wall biosynthesis